MESIVAKTYRVTQQWNHWLTCFLGKSLLESETKALTKMLAGKYGKQTLLLGVPHQNSLLQSSAIARKYLLSPLLNRDKSYHYIEGDFYDLPIQSGSVDQVILPHTLELLDNPHQLLSEACRIVKPEGCIFILGFNPYSMWGLRKYLVKNLTIPWTRSFISSRQVINWLALADFELEKQNMILFRPPTQHQSLYKKFKFLEWIGKKCYKAFGGVYILQAKAKVTPLTPIRLHWTQELSGTRITAGTIPGPSIRNHS
jgi:SAM-dependent methyltransferase